VLRSCALTALLLLASCGDAARDDAAAAANASNAAANAAAAKAQEPLPDTVRVRLETEAGDIVLALDAKRAPVTTANFVRYVDAGRFDGTSFYRASRTPGAEGRGFIQGGIRRDVRRMYPAITHEPTSETGIRHREGTISMARAEMGAGAIGDFFITASAMPSLDARGDSQGYAAFGRVVEGMDVVRRILAAPTAANAGRGAMRGQMLAPPVRILRARRAEEAEGDSRPDEKT
jgi:peptidyl-prolyl cis-trans isomerase A (cyclophilin A)